MNARTLLRLGRRAGSWFLGAVGFALLGAWLYAWYKLLVVPLGRGLVHILFADDSFYLPSILMALTAAIIIGSTVREWQQRG